MPDECLNSHYEDSKPKCDTSGENNMKNTAGLPSGWGA